LRKVFLDEVNYEKYRKGINWDSLVGTDLRFEYDDIKGYFKILKYDKSKRVVEAKYNNNTCNIQTSSILKGKIGSLFGHTGNKQQDFRFNVGDIYLNKKIINTYRAINSSGFSEKWYEYECLIDGYAGKQKEHQFLKHSCPICKKIKTKDGINSIKDLRSKVFQVVIDDITDEPINSKRRVDWKCPFCKGINNHRLSYLCKMEDRLPCRYCSDGISYPEKIYYNLMRQLNNSFEKQKSFKWSQGRKYDGYDDKCLYHEVHGGQHYEDTFASCGGRTLEEEQENDRLKKELAYKNDKNILDYIVIDARKSDFEYIKNSILKSRLSLYYDLQQVDWVKIYKLSCKSIKAQVIEMYKNGIDITEIGCKTNLSLTTIYTYLNDANNFGLINYKKKQGFKDMPKDKHKEIIKKSIEKTRKPVFNFDLDGTLISEFYSKEDAARTYGVSSQSIGSAIKNGWLCANFLWSLDKNACPKYINNNIQKVCAINIETKDVKIYDSITYASKVHKTNRTSICECLSGKYKQMKGWVWLYYNDYINLSIEEIDKIIVNAQKSECKNETICLETLAKYDSLSDAARWCGLKSGSDIGDCCRLKRKSAGKHPETGEKLHWMYYEDYIKLLNVS
jgi:hypothetical protein